MVSSYLESRTLIARGPEYKVIAGDLQSSIRNLAYDTVLNIDLPKLVEMLAYTLVVTARSERVLHEVANEALTRMTDWMTSHHLELVPEKTEALHLIGQNSTKGNDFVMSDHPIDIRKEAKDLGIVLHRGLTGSAHIEYVTGKAAPNLARIVSRVSGV